MARQQSELYAGGELYIFTHHLFVNGNFPAISGSKLVPRDFVDRRILDPDGDQEYQLGLLRGTIPYGDDMKLCSRCHRWLPTEAGYARDSTRPDGKDCYCRKCRKQANAMRYEARVGRKARSYRTLALAI